MNLKQYLQMLCIVLCTIGIIMEAIQGGDIWLLLITAGSLAFAISCKLENRPTRNEINTGKEGPLCLEKED